MMDVIALYNCNCFKIRFRDYANIILPNYHRQWLCNNFPSICSHAFFSGNVYGHCVHVKTAERWWVCYLTVRNVHQFFLMYFFLQLKREWRCIPVMCILFCQFKGECAAFIQVGEEIRKIPHMFKMHSSFPKNSNILGFISSWMSQETANSY
jgi:hypothetical protein